jgi:hypothetical protein
MKKDFYVNYENLEAGLFVFTRSTDIVGRLIQAVRKILTDKSAPNHVGIITEDNGQMFITEETGRGLEERSLERYTKKSNRIVAVMKYTKATPRKIKKVQRYLAEIRRRALENSKYDFVGLLSFVFPFAKPDKNRQWCSENCASILKMMGASWVDRVEIAPDELLKKMVDSGECELRLGFYR